MDCGNDVITSCIVDEAKGHSHTGVILFVKRGLNPVNSKCQIAVEEPTFDILHISCRFARMWHEATNPEGIDGFGNQNGSQNPFFFFFKIQYRQKVGGLCNG